MRCAHSGVRMNDTELKKEQNEKMRLINVQLKQRATELEAQITSKTEDRIDLTSGKFIPE